MAQTNDDQLKAKVDAYVDEVWEDVVEDIRTLVRIESVEDLSAAEPGKPYGPKANEALVAAEGIASRLGLAVTDLDGCIGYGEVTGREGAPYVATIAHSDIARRDATRGLPHGPWRARRQGPPGPLALGCALLCPPGEGDRRVAPLRPSLHHWQQ